MGTCTGGANSGLKALLQLKTHVLVSQQVIHWRPAANVESYMQECGRAGHCGLPSCALLCVMKSNLRKKKNLSSNNRLLLECSANNFS